MAVRNCRRGHWAVIVLSVLPAVLTACAVGPNFKPPNPAVPTSWVGQAPSASRATTVSLEQSLIDWWRVFKDPMLTSLVEQAIAANLDVKLAESRIRQARAERGVAASAFWPQITGTGEYTRSRTPVKTGTGGSGAVSTSGSGGTTIVGTTGTGGASSTQSHPKTVGVLRSFYSASLGAVWPLDIFGGVRRSVEAANANIRAAEEDRRDVLVTLAADVATNYISLRSFQQQIIIGERNLRAQLHSVKVTRERFEGGFVGALDVRNAEALAATTKAQIPVFETSYRQAVYSLSVLLGEPPGALLADLSTTLSIPPAPPTVPIGVPSELVRRRPDIRRAEEQLHAATANVGVAVANFFPSVTLSGSVGLQGSRLKDFSYWVNRAWSAGPTVSVPIFEGGQVVSNIRVEKALEQQSLLTYEKTILTALQDVENSLIASTNEQIRRDSLKQAVIANRKAVDLANELYTEGETDFLNVLDAQRSLLTSEDALTQSNRAISTDLVSLYKALGGGWNCEPER